MYETGTSCGTSADMILLNVSYKKKIDGKDRREEEEHRG